MEQEVEEENNAQRHACDLEHGVARLRRPGETHRSRFDRAHRGSEAVGGSIDHPMVRGLRIYVIRHLADARELASQVLQPQIALGLHVDGG